MGEKVFFGRYNLKDEWKMPDGVYLSYEDHRFQWQIDRTFRLMQEDFTAKRELYFKQKGDPRWNSKEHIKTK